MINHNPICSCTNGLIGDPFVRCYPAPTRDEPPPTQVNPCFPSPCGLYAECRPNGNNPSCSCLPNYFGSPPNCRPECVVNSDCASDKACIAEKCRNPCEGSCGFNSGKNQFFQSKFACIETDSIRKLYFKRRMSRSKSHTELYVSPSLHWRSIHSVCGNRRTR